MPQVIIDYKNENSLDALKTLAKTFGFLIKPIASTQPQKAAKQIKGVTLIGNGKIDAEGLSDIFSGKNIDAKELRQQAWKRKS